MGTVDLFFDAFRDSNPDMDNPSVEDHLLKNFNVHSLLSQIREEDIPLYYNPRHAHTARRDSVVPKKVFREFKADTPEVMANIVKHDWDKMLIKKVIRDDEQIKKIKQEVTHQLPMLKDVYSFLQSKSKNYPWVSSVVMKSFFIDKLDLGTHN